MTSPSSRPNPPKGRFRRSAVLFVAALIGMFVILPLSATPAVAAECGDSSHIFTTVPAGGTISTLDTFALGGVVKPSSFALFDFHVVRPNGSVKNFSVVTNRPEANCVIPHQAETIPADFIGKGDVTVHGRFNRWEDGQVADFFTSFHITGAGRFNPPPLPPTRCGDASHPFVTQSGPFVAFSGIVYPGSRMYFFLKHQSDFGTTLTVINPTVQASGNCVLPHGFDTLRFDQVVFLPPGSRTDIYATYVRAEDGVTVHDQYVTTLTR